MTNQIRGKQFFIDQAKLARTRLGEIKNGIVNKTMPIDPFELECQLDIVNLHSERLMESMFEINENNYVNAHSENLIVETKSIIKSSLAKSKANIAESSKKAKQLQDLQRQRTTTKNSILHIKKGLINKTTSFDSIELECRLEILNSYSDKLLECQSKIEDLDENDMVRSELEDLIVETKSIIKSILAKNKANIAESTNKTELPKINLPQFTGKYSEYKNFMDTFESVVHNDPNIADIDKFKHLLNCLSGEALGTIKTYRLSAENYPQALANLKKVYDNKCLILFDTIAKLLELPKIAQPTAYELRTIINSVTGVYETFLTLGDEKAITNALIIQLVMQKVDPATRAKWEEQLDYDDELPLWRDCEAVLNERYQTLLLNEASSFARSRLLK